MNSFDEVMIHNHNEGRHLSFAPAEQFHIKAPGVTETTTHPEATEFALAAFLGGNSTRGFPKSLLEDDHPSMINDDQWLICIICVHTVINVYNLCLSVCVIRC